MATATSLLNVARSHLGNVGGATFRAPFGAPAGTPWCAYFISYVLRQAGVSGPWTGWTPALVTWAKANGRWKTSNPKPGDVAMFMWPTVSSRGRGNPPVCHAGFVEAVNRDGSITTIEGNTSASVNGSQYNGNVCARRVRSGSVIKGYISMSFDGAPATGGGTGGSGQSDIDRMNAGYSVDWTRSIQDKLNRAGYGPLDTDGVRGDRTAAAIRAFQKNTGLTQDGIAGADTNRMLDKVLAGTSKPTPAPVAYANVTGLQGAVGATKDNVWGGDTEKRFDALREATEYHRVTRGLPSIRFPWGVAYTQGIVGTKQDGSWGANSRKAHDAKVKQVQRLLGVHDDGIWGKNTEDAYLSVRSRAKKP